MLLSKGLLEAAKSETHSLTQAEKLKRGEKLILTYSWVMVVRESMTNELHCHCCRGKRKREEKRIISPPLNRNRQQNTWITHKSEYQLRLRAQSLFYVYFCNNALALR